MNKSHLKFKIHSSGKRIGTLRKAVLVLALLSAFPLIAAGGSKTIKMVKMGDYKPQDAVRDSLRYALCQVRDHGLSFWAREYPINEGFFKRAEINEVEVLSDHPALHYKLWLNDKKSPFTVILPGMGSHFQGAGLNAMAQTYYDAGYSVAVISSSMNWEFYLAASRSKAPGYPPLDAEDIRLALRKIIADVRKRHPDSLGSLHLVGYSLGALQSLFIAEQESKTRDKIGFASYLAIHPPVNMRYSLSVLDDFFARWKEWRKRKAALKIERAAAAYLALVKRGLPKNGKISVERDAAEVIIALSYRYALNELLLAIKKEGNDMGLIKTPYGFYRNDLHKEIEHINFKTYAEKFIIRSVVERIGGQFTMKDLEIKGSPRSISDFLSKNKNIRIVNSMDDFLLKNDDLRWFADTFGDNALFFEYGGHLGELYTPVAKRIIVEFLSHPLN